MTKEAKAEEPWGFDVRIDDLRKVTSLLLDHNEESGDTVRIEESYYWDIPEEFLYNPYCEKSDIAHSLTLGDVSDQWKDLMKWVDRPDHVIGYGLVWLGAMF